MINRDNPGFSNRGINIRRESRCRKDLIFNSGNRGNFRFNSQDNNIRQEHSSSKGRSKGLRFNSRDTLGPREGLNGEGERRRKDATLILISLRAGPETALPFFISLVLPPLCLSDQCSLLKQITQIET
jgi:hypothetical protein